MGTCHRIILSPSSLKSGISLGAHITILKISQASDQVSLGKVNLIITPRAPSVLKGNSDFMGKLKPKI